MSAFCWIEVLMFALYIGLACTRIDDVETKEKDGREGANRQELPQEDRDQQELSHENKDQQELGQENRDSENISAHSESISIKNLPLSLIHTKVNFIYGASTRVQLMSLVQPFISGTKEFPKPNDAWIITHETKFTRKGITKKIRRTTWTNYKASFRMIKILFTGSDIQDVFFTFKKSLWK